MTVAPTPHDSAAQASLDTLLLTLSREACPMPVVRADWSHDTLMVWPRRRAGRLPAVPAWAQCYNRFFK